MNLYFGLFCCASVLFNSSSELGFDFFAFAIEEKTVDCYSSYARLFSFYTQQNVNSAVNFELTSKTGLPRVVLGWCYGGFYFFQKYSSLQSWSLNSICTVAIPGQILAR